MGGLAHASTATFLRSISLKSMAAPRPGPLGDPVVRRVEAVGDHDQLDPRIARHVHVGIADDEDLEPVTLGHAVDLGLHWAGIGVDIDRRQDNTATFLRSISLKSMVAPRPGPLGTCTRPSRPTTMSCSSPYFCAPSGSNTSKKVVLRIAAMT